MMLATTTRQNNLKSLLRQRMLLTTALVGLGCALPSAAHAQLVDSGDLSSAVDSAGNPGRLTVTNTSATQTDIELESAVVIAEWTDFNVDMGDTVNVTIDSGLGLSEATLFNRVIGGNPSNINGTINAADINFWLINQNGILFGSDASISAQSFFASTIDVANQDIFDFYEGTDLFGNGTDTLGFAGASTQAVQALSGASFVTDGSLAFVGQQLDLTGTFDAQTGRAAFIAASDVDVSFTPGSPLTYTVNAGTTVATQNIDGTIEGASAEFAVFTAAGVVNALLDIDASITATTAVSTDTGVLLIAQGLGADKPDTEFGGVISTNGNIVMVSDGDITATANMTGNSIEIDAVGAIGAANMTGNSIDIDAGGAFSTTNTITATDGDLTISASSISTGALDAEEGGGVILTSSGNITTTSITSNEPGATNGFIDVESTGGGTLDLGALSSDGDIALDTSGLVTTSTISTLGDLTIGGTTTATTVTFTGNVSTDLVDITATGTVTGLDIDATDGDLDITAGSISGNALSATGGDVLLQATGNITTTSITANEDFASMGGDIDVDSTGGGTLDLGAVTGDGAANFDTSGTLTLGTVNVGGAMEIGGLVDPATLNLNGNITAGSFTSESTNAFSTTNTITATDGDLTISASSISTGALDAEEGGGVILTSSGNITTTSITSNEPGATNGFIDVQSTGGGALDLGALSSDGDIAIDTTGSLTTASISTLNDLTIGGVADPSSITFTGNVSADIVDIDSTGAVMGLAIDATDGDLDINAASISAGAVSATGGDVILQATGNVTTTSITSDEDFSSMGGDIDVDSTGGGTLNLGTVTGDGAANFDTSGTLTLGTVNVGGAMVIGGVVDPATLNLNGNITAGSFTSNSANAFSTTNDITATDGNLSITAASISTGDLDAENGGGVILTSSGNITTTSITSNEPGATNGFIDVESTGGGTLDLGALSSDGDIALDTSGLVTTSTISTLGDLTIGGTTTATTVTFTGNVSADLVDITATGTVTGLDIDATDGDLDITAGSISGNALSATGGDVLLQATGNITTTSITANEDFASMGGDIDVDSTGGGTLDLGAVTGDGAANFDTSGTLTLGTVNVGGAMVIGGVVDPATLNLNGNITAGSFTSNSANAFSTTNTITATDGDLTISASSISTGALDAEEGGGVILTASGNITTSSITSNEPGATNGFIDVQSTGGGALDLGALSSDGDIAIDTTGSLTTASISTLNDLTIGGVADPSSITFTGNVSADIVDIDSTGAVTGLAIDATDGDLNVNAASINAGALSSTGGTARLQATGDISATSVSSSEDFLSMGGDVIVDAGGAVVFGGGTADGAVDLTAGTNMAINGLLSAGGDVTATSPGNFTFGAAGQINGAKVVIATDAAFINNRGSDAITASGNWIVYSNNPADNTFGDLNSGNTAFWNSTKSSRPVSSITDNRYVFVFQPTVTVSATDIAKTYGDDVTAALATAFTVSGLEGGNGAYLADTASDILSGSPTITSSGAAADADVAGSPYAINIAAGTLTASNGYLLSIGSGGELTVTPLAITGTALVDDKTYDGTTDATGTVTLNGVLAGDDVGTSGTIFTFADANAGTGITVNITGTTLTGGDAGNYTLTVPATALADILAKAITGSVVVDDKTYDGTTDATGTVTLNGVLAGDDVGTSGTIFTFADANAGTGITVNITGTTLTGGDAGNYTLTVPATALADILAKAITGSVVVDDKTYDGTTDATGTVTLNGVLAGDDVGTSGTIFTFADANAGTGITVNITGTTLTGGDAGNYTLTVPATALADILAKAITGSVVVDDKTYDGTTDATGTVTLNGVLAGDDVGTSGTIFTFADANAGTGITVNITGTTLTGGDAGNYTLTVPATALADILAKAITGSVVVDDKTYDGTTDATGTVTLNGVLAGDDVGTSGTIFTFADANAGTGITVNITGTTLTGGDAGNYTLTVPATALADILAKAITGSVVVDDKTYDGTTDATGTVTLNGVLAGDDVGTSGTIFTFADANAGTGITVNITGTTLTGGDAGNYTLTVPATALADILAKAITGSVVVDDKTYDGTTDATGTVTLNGVLAGDDVGTSGTIFTFADANAGTGITVNITGTTLTGGDAGNYTLTVPATALADILAKAITGSVVVDDKTYDGTTDATGTVTLNGVLAGDDVGTSGTIFTFADANAGTGITVNITGTTLTGGDAGNYTLTVPATALADILAKAITGSVVVDDKTYDGTTDATGTVTLNGVLAGDDVGTSGTIFTFADANAGTGITVNITGTTLTGGDAGNYTLTVPATALADILQRILQIEAVDASKRQGDDDPVLTFVITGDGLVDGDAVAGSLARDTGELPGEFDINIGSLDAGANYIIEFTGGTFTITAAPVSPPTSIETLVLPEAKTNVDVEFNLDPLCPKGEELCEVD